MIYERSVERKLRRELLAGRLEGILHAGQWLHWAGQWLEGTQLKGGLAYAQPDFFIETKEQILLIECKLTQSDVAEAQLDFLYRPLLRHIFNRPILMLQVCKFLRHPIGPLEIHSPGELQRAPYPGIHTWHWPGRN